MNLKQAAEAIERNRIDWGLGEVMHGATPPDLRASILSALDRAARRHVSRRRTWRAAAALLVSIGIVSSVAIWHDRTAADVQVASAEPATVHDEAEIAALPRHTTDVTGVDLTPAEIAKLVARCPDLERLDLSTNPQRPQDLVNDDAIANVAQLGKLRGLTVGYCRSLTNDGLSKLTDLPMLERLSLTELGQGVRLDFLRRIPLLTSLALRRSQQVEGSEFDVVWELTRLESLDLSHTASIETVQFVQLSRLVKLRDLDLTYHNGLSVLPPGVKGKRIQRPGYGIDTRVTRAIAQLPLLETLRLHDCNLQDNSLIALADAPSLVELDVGRNLFLGQAALTTVLEARQLERLDLQDCISLQPTILDAIAKQKSLQFLDISRLRWVDDERVQQLRDTRPDLELIAPARSKGRR